MADLAVTPEYLEQLARILDRAANQADRTNAETTHIPHKVETSWGSTFRAVNDAFVHAERGRREAMGNITRVCNDLAAKLRATANAYASSDTLAGENLDSQMIHH